MSDYYPDEQDVFYRKPFITFSDTKVALPIGTDPNHSIYLYNGQGLFIDSYMSFSSQDTLLTFKIDGVDVFTDLDLDFLDDEVKNQEEKIGMLTYHKLKSALGIHPKEPISFNSSFEILARANDDTTVDMNSYLIQHTKE